MDLEVADLVGLRDDLFIGLGLELMELPLLLRLEHHIMINPANSQSSS